MYYDRLSIEDIQKNIEKSLRIHKIKCRVTIEYNCQAILVTNGIESHDDRHLYMWIRLIPTQIGTYYVDITNIVLPVDKRRQGVLTTLFKRLNSCRYVERTSIVSVCTQEMRNWCIKNNLEKFGYNCYH